MEKSHVIVLGVESSCDETAVALLRAPLVPVDGESPELLSSVISTQIPLHRLHGGVVPELASRNHSLALPLLVRQACAEAGVLVREVDCFAATAGPGLASSLLVGNTTAKALAFATGRPFLAVNHLEGHLLSPFINDPDGPPPHLGMVVSGGHTLFIDVKGFGDYHLIGRSLDDAAGEAFDKVGKMLGLAYPGGPEIEKTARGGNPHAFDFPRAMMKEPHANVSFSGLKTAVLYTLPKVVPSGNPADMTADRMADVCASFQQAVVDVLVSKLKFCLKQTGYRTVAVSGGVACNAALREALQKMCSSRGVTLRLSPPGFSTDNAAMIAYIGLQKFRRGDVHALNEDVDPNLPLADGRNRTKGGQKKP